jgi:hypothetical protein
MQDFIQLMITSMELKGFAKNTQKTYQSFRCGSRPKFPTIPFDDRNCPKCGNLKKEQWILDRKTELLPVPYFHLVLYFRLIN